MPRSKKHQEAQRWMTAYLGQYLCPALKIPVVFDEIEYPERGLKSNVLLVRPKHHPPFALRCSTNINEAQQLVRLSKFAEASQLPTPRLVYHDFSKAHYKEHGFATVVEDLINGTHLTASEVSEKQLQQLGYNLSRLHKVDSPRWGHPDRFRTGPYFESMIFSKIKNRISSIAKHDPQFDLDQRNKILNFVRRIGKRWKTDSYALTHDKINPGNVLFADNGDVYFLDLISLRFGTPGKDLIAALYYFCVDEGAEAILKEAYFENMKPADQDHFNTFEPLYRAWHHLGRWASKARANFKSQDKKSPNADKPTQGRSVAREREATWRWIERG